MFSYETRCIYRNNPLGEVICQLRFPEILAIETQLPVEFQEAIREDFPRYAARREPVKRPGAATNNAVNYQFSTADGQWRVNLTGNFISLSCSRYTRWEEFAAKLDHPLAAFIQQYHPAYFERVGLRYLNFVSRKALDLEGTPFRDLFQPAYLGLLEDEEVLETNASRCSVDAEIAIRGGCRARLHSGPGLITRGGKQDSEVKFIFDQDLFMPGQVPVNLSAGALQTLHSQADALFRGAITPLLHRAMDPQEP